MAVLEAFISGGGHAPLLQNAEAGPSGSNGIHHNGSRAVVPGNTPSFHRDSAELEDVLDSDTEDAALVLEELGMFFCVWIRPCRTD